MPSLQKALITAIILPILFVSTTMAMDLKASLPYIPGDIEDVEKGGPFIDLIKAIDDVYEEGRISIEIFPFARSLYNVISGKADFHLPFIKNPNVSPEPLSYTYSTVTLMEPIFILCTNKYNTEINLNNFKEFKIETDRAHVSFFDFNIEPTSSIEGSLQKLAAQRIDGLLFAAPVAAVIKKMGLNDRIRLWKYGTFETKFILQNTDRGKQIDAILTKAIEKLRKSGRYEKIMGPILKANEALATSLDGNNSFRGDRSDK